MGHGSQKKFRLSARKNWERKKYPPKPLILNIKVPRSVADKAIFVSQLKKIDLSLRGWIMTHISYLNGVRMCKLDDSSPLGISIAVCDKLCSVYVGLQPVPSFQQVPVDGIQDLLSFLDKLNRFCLCPGINDVKYVPLIEKHNGKFHDSHGK